MRDTWAKRLSALLIGGLIGVYTPESMRWIVLGIFLLVLIRIAFWKPRDFFGPVIRPEVFILCASILVGFVYGQTASYDLAPPLTMSQVQVIGELKDWSVNDDGAIGIFEILEPVTIPESSLAQENGTKKSPKAIDFLERKYRLRVYFDAEGNLPEGWEGVRPGDKLKYTGKIEQPKPPGTPGEFDYPLYYAVRGLSGGITAQGKVDLLNPGKPPLGWLVRNQVREHLAAFSLAQTGLLEGILFGDTRRIPEEALESYRITGVYHVFSASGSNVAFLLLLCWNMLFLVHRFPRVGLTIGVLIFYAILCGGNPPILRATIMVVFVLLGKLGKGRGNSLRGLLLAAFFLFIWQPLILEDIGFQLSFMATWGIIVLSPVVIKVKGIRSWPKFIKSAFSMSCAAQVATLPLMISAFHRLSIIGLLANLLVLFILGSIFQLGILGAFLSFIPQVALPLFQVSLWLLNGVNKFLIHLAGLPWADVWVVNPGALFWLCWYGWILVLLVSKAKLGFIISVRARNLRRKISLLVEKVPASIREVGMRVRKFAGLNKKSKKYDGVFKFAGQKLGFNGQRALIVLLLLLFMWSPWNTPSVLQVTFIDVGQGDCILIETPKGARVMVDAGPKTNRFDAGEQIIVPYLLQQGIKRLDALILTHPHSDHVGGASAILETIPVGWVGIPEDGKDWLSLDSAEESGSGGSQWDGWEEVGLDWNLVRVLEMMTIERLTCGDTLVLDSNSRLKVLAPGAILSGTESDENNNSLVLRLENEAGQSVLFTGDMEEELMGELYRSGQVYDADLFKVPHHGSRYSMMTDLLDQIDPQAVIISVGRNSFGHPSSEVLSYWEERHVPVFRTDEDGTIQVKLDGKSIEVVAGREK
ncbi:ComEC/Rec2-related protein [Desulfitobacterium dichloroeliminans LMG P-21439]|uniref:ComEC/Rec2-related protein n=1 Tax=Desulfitobacterium dichloroeliminans (strain LMG P-21439 / DCA1) TaxID=871963 RepID=L0FBV5_DESDL|nr:ComEC/Rec2 family competence protein [Desulfitobacterium dichloroeliminans]AGA70428.1 ComEC/Rec2-related protein [Desulfitobacterium dichloroeliminans LMG P-21439]